MNSQYYIPRFFEYAEIRNGEKNIMRTSQDIPVDVSHQEKGITIAKDRSGRILEIKTSYIKMKEK